MKKECRECKSKPTQMEKLQTAVEFAKPIAVTLAAAVIIVGILVVFASSIFGNQTPGIEAMSQFVSIVLGVVATIVSIVSMLISFYGLEKTEESERRQQETLNQIIRISEETNRSAKATEQKVETSIREKTSHYIEREEQSKNLQTESDAI